MANQEIVRFEHQLPALEPTWENLLSGIMPIARFRQTVMVCVEKNPYLLECDRQTFFNSITSSAVLQLPMDGVTGQAWPIPFKKKVQLVIGYCGFNSLGARAGMSISGEVVREGDKFEFDLGEGYISHKPTLSTEGRIIGAWAKAAALDRPAIITVLGIDEIMDIKKRSAAVASGRETPWNDPKIGFPAMASKSAKRRLRRSMPMFDASRPYHLAARMEEAHEEQGALSHLRADGALMIEGHESPLPQREPNETPKTEDLLGPKPDAEETQLRADGMRAAAQGMKPLVAWFNALSDRQKRTANRFFDGEMKARAREVDS